MRIIETESVVIAIDLFDDFCAGHPEEEVVIEFTKLDGKWVLTHEKNGPRDFSEFVRMMKTKSDAVSIVLDKMEQESAEVQR